MVDFAKTRAVAKNAGTDRVVVNGQDVTWFRADAPGDTPLKVPGYTLTEPFAYGASQPLLIPRTNSLFEQYGTADLAWLKKGARVQYQRQTDDGIVTDYRGFITSIRTSDREFVAEVAGELSGRANLIDRPPPIIRKRSDIGVFVAFTMEGLGHRLTPRFPDTGITVIEGGGTTALSWLQTLCAWTRTEDSQQWSIMPEVWGGTTWVFAEKDVTTKHFTVFADGQRIQLDLVDDLTEQPNTIIGNGVSLNGERWRNSRYPGIFQGTPAPYPFADTSHAFGTGTTDADTDTGDGITIMVRKLAWTNYLNDSLSNLSEYTSDVARAVNRLKDEAGLVENGIMTAEAWAALWDTDVVSYSTEGARIFPLVQDPTVRPWNYSSTGGLLGRNDAFVSGIIRVDRSIDFGVCEKSEAVRYAKHLIDNDGHQWAGTVTLNDISVFSGERDADYVADVDDIMPARDIRPGMNVWLPQFDGGTLLHVAGVDVNGTTVTLTVSSAALDIFDLTQALQRNADSKRNVYREWSEQNRGVRPANKMISSDEFFGRLWGDVSLTGGQWNVIEIVMGQSGTVARTDIRLTNTATEFCFAVFDKEVSDAWMNGVVGNPFNYDGDDLTTWEHEHVEPYVANRDLRLVEGNGKQPCGYSWKKGYDSNTGDRTANPLVGTFLSDASWVYGTDPEGAPVVYLTIWPLEDCTLRRGHLFFALLDDVT